MLRRTVLFFALVALAISPAFGQTKRPLNVDDLYNLKTVSDPQRSPDGDWVAFTVSRAIKDTDKNDSDVWMASWDGSQQIQLTSSPEGESMPRWSPDGKYLGFVSSRQDAKDGQLWLLNRLGGEAVKVTDVKGGVSDYVWSPDGSRIVLAVDEPDPTDPKDDETKEGEKKKTPPPIVINRYHWKQDVQGYLRGQRTHLYLFDVATQHQKPSRHYVLLRSVSGKGQSVVCTIKCLPRSKPSLFAAPGARSLTLSWIFVRDRRPIGRGTEHI